MKSAHQRDFFQKIQVFLPEKISFASWLQEVLGLSAANSYKKINGDVALTHIEIAIICEKIPEAAFYLPQLLNLPNTFVGRLNGFSNSASVGAFLRATNHNLSRLKKIAHNLNYMARDISFFWFLGKPKLFAFKMALWTNTLNVEGLNAKEARAFFPLARDLYKTYLDLNSVEVWYQHGMINLMEQLRAAMENEKILPADVATIKEELLHLCEDFSRYALCSQKNEGSLIMMSTPFSTMQNGGLFHSAHHKYLMAATVDARHFTSQNENLIAYFEQAFEGQTHFAQNLGLKNYNIKFFSAMKEVLETI